MNNKNIRLATPQDIQRLVLLINSAYRSNLGWTHEHEIVMGERINDKQLLTLMAQSNIQFFVLEIDQTIVGCIGLTQLKDEIEIGSFAVDPHKQNEGYGKILLNYAESYATQKNAINALIMSVLNVRHELLAYYERRGYVRTGKIEPYPIAANVGIPQVQLHLVLLKKTAI